MSNNPKKKRRWRKQIGKMKDKKNSKIGRNSKRNKRKKREK
jgi:hypothetical protein